MEQANNKAMKMVPSRLKQIILFLLLAAVTPSAFAGVSTSGGGFAVVCRNAEGQIKTAQLLDLYEAQFKYGFELQKPTGDMMKDYVTATNRAEQLKGESKLPKLINNEAAVMQYLADSLLKKTVFTKPNQKVPRLVDVGNYHPLPAGCELEAVARYTDKPVPLLIDSEIWAAFDSLNQAALIEHELQYFLDRIDDSYLTSEYARLVVAHIFASEASVEVVHSGLPSDGVQWCMTDEKLSSQTGFYIYPSQDRKNLTLQLVILSDRRILAKAIAEIPIELSEQDFRAPIKSSFNLNWSVQLKKMLDNSFEVKFFQDEKLIQTSQVYCQ